MNEEILDKKIKTWEDQLLDLGRRNKMISYRETKRSTLKILNPSFDDLYQQIVVEGKELTFQKAIDSESDIRVYSILSLLDKLSSPLEVTVGDIKTGGTLSETVKTLKNLRAKAKLAMNEQGTNILYLVFGFIEWRMHGNRSNNWVKSPLILVPVSLVLPSLNAQYTLKRYEDDIVVNPTLAYLFERDYGIILPEFDPDKDTLESFMEKMEELVDDLGWRIHKECSIGLVSFLKISMYNDLLKHEEQIKNNPIIRTFAGERNEVNTVDQASITFDHDACRAVDTYQVLDADSSQQDAIVLSQKGFNFVMQGPPGTGKSQTIANIIAQGLADGKKILFVSEKMAALEVVYRRLTDVHLADFCLSLHSHKANKKEILDQLRENLSLQRIKVKDEEVAKLTRLDMIREQLIPYVHDIHKVIMPLEMSLYEVYGAIAELGDLPDIELHLEHIEQFTKDEMNRLVNIVTDFERAQEVLGPLWYKNPWQDITVPYLEVSQKKDLQNNLQMSFSILSELGNCKLEKNTLADHLTLDSFDSFWQLYELAQCCSTIPHDWFYRSTDHEELQVRALQEKKVTIDQLQNELADKYEQEYFELHGQELKEKILLTMKDDCSLLHKNESKEEIFKLMEEDLQQVENFRNISQKLIEMLDAFTEKYKLNHSYDFNSVDEILTLIEMLLEKKDITEWYFSDKNADRLIQYVSELHNTLSSFAQQKIKLCERYNDAILDYENAKPLKKPFIQASSKCLPLLKPNILKYQDLCTVAKFDQTKLESIGEALENPLFDDMTNAYGFIYPTTLLEVDKQIDAIEKAKNNNIVSSWKSLESRNKAKEILQEGLDRTRSLTDHKQKLDTFFLQWKIILDIEHLTESDVDKFKHAHEEIPEAESIVASCNNNDAYLMLDTIDQKVIEYNSLNEKIKKIRSEYRMNENFGHLTLFRELQGCRDEAVACSPCQAWATSKQEANALLEQSMSLANTLKAQYSSFLETYEKTVFDLDFTGMLNRFKADYTNFFKIFKSAYREDVKTIRMIYKDIHKKVKDEEIIDLLQALRKYNEDLDRYQSLSANIDRLLNIQEYDIWFNWDNVKKRMDIFDRVSNFCQDDSAAYRFITENNWDKLLVPLINYEELFNWFANNEDAQKYFSSMYTGQNTDTAQLKSLLDNAQTMSALFADKENYMKYMISKMENELLIHAHQNAESIIEIRNWYSNHAQDIKEYTGITELEETDAWEESLKQLTIFESIAASVGEETGFRIVTNYQSDSLMIDRYLENLKSITNIEGCTDEVLYIDANQTELKNTGLNELINNLHIITDSSNTLLTAYADLLKYSAEVAERSVEEIKDDLENIIFYQTTRDNLMDIEKEAHIRIGKEYKGLETNWEKVNSNIAFSNKVIQLLSGNVTSELVNSFVNKLILYSQSELETMKHCYKIIIKIKDQYTPFNHYKNIKEIHTILSKLSVELKETIRMKNSIITSSYDEYGYLEIIEDLQKLIKLQNTWDLYKEELKKSEKYLSVLSLDQNTDWEYTLDIFKHLKMIKREINSGTLDPEIEQFISNGIPETSVSSYFDKVEKVAKYKNIMTEITRLFTTRTTLDSYSLTKLTRRFQSCIDQFSTLDAWIDLRECKKICIDNGLNEFISKAEDSYYSSGELKGIFKKSFYYQWFEKVCGEIDSVSSFRIRTQEGRVKDFRELDSHQLPVDQMRIRERLIQKMPSQRDFVRTNDEMGILFHELSKKRNIMPLRKLFRSIPNLLLKLKPCLMMSPLSVAYFLEAETYNFDMVIFDEASQIFPQDAIGAIFRAKQVIIAGDSKQMPPTNFFSASISNDDDFDSDEDEEDINFDSILEEASNSLMNHSLLWHYRSRYEELISFSNNEIYQNNLITFPSCTTQEKDTGVEYIYVPNGVYEKRINRTEAKKIVQLVEEHIKNHSDRSLGVIAFSESQQSVIEEEVNKFRMKHLSYEKFFDEAKDEPFFIKNLENVQGDERDTIIFSIGYAKNAQGTFYMRFGPLGRLGGERRLNVAITRAKYNVKLVGSIRPEEIDLSKVHSQGVRMLRSYIMFAIHGSSVLPKSKKKNGLYDVDTFCEQVGQFLISYGYGVKMNIGNSDYTIDIAVEHPKKPGHFIAGIECDGNSYYMARTVRDREYLRTSVLERMGWKMYRVWSTEWIRNPKAEKNRLLNFVSEALSHYNENMPIYSSQNETEKNVGTEVIQSSNKTGKPNHTNPYGIPRYKQGDCSKVIIAHGKGRSAKVADIVYSIIKIEQPIHIELLYKRVSQYFKTGRTTQGLRETVDDAMKRYMKNEIIIEDHFVRLKNDTKIQARRSLVSQPDRIIEHISIPEIAAAMEKILHGAYGMERNVLCSETAKVFGFERLGPKIKPRTGEAIEYLVNNDKISIADNKIQLLED